MVFLLHHDMSVSWLLPNEIATGGISSYEEPGVHSSLVRIFALRAAALRILISVCNPEVGCATSFKKLAVFRTRLFNSSSEISLRRICLSLASL